MTKIPRIPIREKLAAEGKKRREKAESQPKRVPWCDEHRRPKSICERYGSTHVRRS